MAGDDAGLVDVIIPIHDASRSLERTITSVVDSTKLQVGRQLRVTVVCHNVTAADIAATLSPRIVAAVSLLELSDGIHSPAGPKNHGLAETSATYVSFIDSDDHLEPGALDAWLHLAERKALAAVIPVERHSDGSLVRTPPTRPWRSAPLHPVKDRLAYRTAPLGLLRREVLHRHGISFAPGFATGEDQQFTAALWLSGERIAYARRAPAYIVGADAAARVTSASRPVADELAGSAALLTGEWYLARTAAERLAVAVKTVRVHVFGAVLKRSQAREWTAADSAFVRGLLAELNTTAPGYRGPLSIADLRLLDALGDPAANGDTILRLAHGRRRFGHPATLLTRSIRGQFASEGPLRFMAASALL